MSVELASWLVRCARGYKVRVFHGCAVAARHLNRTAAACLSACACYEGVLAAVSP